MGDEADKVLNLMVKIGKIDEADLPAIRAQLEAPTFARLPPVTLLPEALHQGSM
jgi:hypothetical protein